MMIIWCLAIVGAVTFGSLGLGPGTVQAQNQTVYQPGEIIVKFRSEPAHQMDEAGLFELTRWPDVNAIIRQSGLSIVQSIQIGSASSVYRLTMSSENELASTLDALQASPNVEYAEPNWTAQATFTPDDPYFNQQWNFTKINASAAWDYDSTAPAYGGDPGVTVAVLDTGVAYEAYADPNTAACLDPVDGPPDCLAAGAAYAQAPDFESASFSSGYDFVNDDSHPNDDNGHGTHVASTIAETTDNQLGAAGLAFHSTIMPVKVLARDGYGTSLMIAQGIDYARQNGAAVINLSLAMSGSSQVVSDAVDAAVSQGVVIVAATGNEAASSISYPARYDAVIAVGASSNTDANSRSSFSNYGEGLDLLAPGGDGSAYVVQQSFSSRDGDNLPAEFVSFGYIGYQGTSMAAPHVSAAAALLKAAGVNGLEISSILAQSAADLGATGYDTQTGYGLLDMANAYQILTEDITAPVSQALFSPTEPNGLNGYYNSRPTVSLAATDNRSGVASLRYHWDAESYIEYSSPLYVPEGVHTLEYYSVDGLGNIETSRQTTFKVDSSAPAVSLNQYSNGSSAGRRRVLIAGAATDTGSGLESVTVNGQAAVLAGNQFELSVTLRPGLNTLTVIATDQAGLSGSTSDVINYSARANVLVAVSGSVPAEVSLYDRTGIRQISIAPWPVSFKVGAILASGDVNGDGVSEMLVAPAQSGGPQVKIYSQAGELLGQLMAYAPAYRGGVNLAGCDTDGDGQDEIITGTSSGRAAHVRIFNGRGQLKGQFFAFPENFWLGVELACGDVDNDGQAEIITAPETPAGPQVRIFNGRGQLEGQFFAFPQDFRLGLNVAVGDLDGNGVAEIVAAPNRQANAQIRIFNRLGQLQGQWFAYPTFFKGGVNLATGDVNADGFDDIITGPASAGGAQVRILDGNGRAQYQWFVKDAHWRGGLSVGSVLTQN